jgi:dolichol-phosphate mannosyltransferase
VTIAQPPHAEAARAADPTDLSVVVPCYNEADGIAALVERLAAVCRPLDVAFEIVLVDDGSRDATWPTIICLRAEHPEIVAVKLSRNHGHQLALTAGLSVCRGRRILIIDADLQDPPELLAEMMRLMDAGADVVYGRRRARAGEGPLKKLTAAVFYRLIQRLSDVPIPPDTGDFRLMSRRALDVLLAMPERHRFIRGMVSWIGFRQEPILYDRAARFAGRTKYNYRKMIRFALDAITGFSVRPLQLASLAGFGFGLIAAAVLAYAFVSWAFFRTVSGWTSLIAVVALLGSVQLFVLGIIGEYLGRLYVQSQGRPLFIIERIEEGAADPVRPEEPAP